MSETPIYDELIAKHKMTWNPAEAEFKWGKRKASKK